MKKNHVIKMDVINLRNITLQVLNIFSVLCTQINTDTLRELETEI